MYLDNMVLYYKPTCPFCQKVLAFMEEEDIALPMRNTLEPGVKDDLARIAGKVQVPCLVVDGVRVRRHHPLPGRSADRARRGIASVKSGISNPLTPC